MIRLISGEKCFAPRHNAQAFSAAGRRYPFSVEDCGVLTGLHPTASSLTAVRISTGAAAVNGVMRTFGATIRSVTTGRLNFIYATTGIRVATTLSTIPDAIALLAVAKRTATSLTLRDLRSRSGFIVLLSPGGATAWRLAVSSGQFLLYKL